MISLKQINKHLYLCHCYYSSLGRRVFSQRNFSLKTSTSKNEITQCLNNELLLEYENKQFFFNTIIESKRMKYGFKANNKQMANIVKYEERISTVLKTIRPLPLGVKYLENKNDDEESNKSQPALSQGINNEQILTKFPYHANTYIMSETTSNCAFEQKSISVENQVSARKEMLDENIQNWMTSYDNYEYDLVQNDNREEATNFDNSRINYGTPNPNCEISKYPCGGCGAHLHCMDTAVPGYIPSEIFENCFKPGGSNLGTILCQRCHFLKEYNIALQVRVSPDDYPKVLKTIPFDSALVVLMVDLTDFPCSIYPGIADLVGTKTPIIVVGNKVDLIPKDDSHFLTKIKELLLENVKLCGFGGTNIKHIELISATTGYGVEKVITSIQSLRGHRGNVYLIGCANVGKSSLFNALLQSDFCKIQAADLIQRATTSPWPGTTLNLLKFPVTNISGNRAFLRSQRLKKLQKIEAQERNVQTESLKESNSVKNATLIGRIERSFDRSIPKQESKDSFSQQGNLSGIRKMGIDERHPDYAFGKWCFDTPGVLHPATILHLLTTEELVMTLPKQLIRPETFCVKPGTSLFIAGLARFDYVSGPNSVRLTVFRAKDLPITVCKIDEADSIYKKLLGSELFVVPIDKGDRLAHWPGLELAKSFKLTGKSWKESSYDVVLSSAGWMAINCGLYDYKFQAWTPEKRGVYVRDCMLPKAVTLRGARIRNSVAYKKNKFI